MALFGVSHRCRKLKKKKKINPNKKTTKIQEPNFSLKRLKVLRINLAIFSTFFHISRSLISPIQLSLVQSLALLLSTWKHSVTGSASQHVAPEGTVTARYPEANLVKASPFKKNLSEQSSCQNQVVWKVGWSYLGKTLNKLSHYLKEGSHVLEGVAEWGTVQNCISCSPFLPYHTLTGWINQCIGQDLIWYLWNKVTITSPVSWRISFTECYV